ncbi:MAG: hypothetical protein ABEH80_00800, partial [Halobaculum sp.]
VIGDVRSNATVTVAAAVSDVPIRQGVVVVDGERVAQTDRRGRATVRLPAEPGPHVLEVRRGDVVANRTVVIHRLNASAEVGWPLALPFAPVTVTATLDGDRVDGANVTLRGEPVGTTGIDGTLSTRLPFAGEATLGVTRYGQRATATVTGLFRSLAAVLLAVTLLVGGVVGGAYRQGVPPRELFDRLRRLPARVARLVLAGVLSVAAAADRAGDALLRFVTDVLAGRLPPEEIPDRLARLARRAASALLAAGLAVIAGLRAAVTDALRDSSTDRASGSAGSASDDETERDEEAVARQTIRATWRQFLRLLSVGSVRSLTPGEVARWAVQRDHLPSEPVRRLRDSYRAVEYGDERPTTYVDRVTDALATLTDGDDESSGGDGQ